MRWRTLVLIGSVAALAAAAGAPGASSARDSRGPMQELVPTVPWALVADARDRPTWPSRPPPVSVHPRLPQRTAPAPAAIGGEDGGAAAHEPRDDREMAAQPATSPPVETLARPWYLEPRTTPMRPYLERLLVGEAVEGWLWDPGEYADEAEPLDERRPEDTRRLSFGFDSRIEQGAFRNDKGNIEDAALIGPSMRWRPTSHTHFDISPLVGVNTPDSMSEVVLVFGWKY